MTASPLQQSLQLALQHHHAGRLPQAELLYRQILAQNPRQPNALHLLGLIALQANRHDLAIDLIRQSLAVNPQNPEAHFHLGTAHMAKNQPDAAINAFRQVALLDPKSAPAHSNLATSLAENGQLVEAIAAFRKSLALDPNQPEILGNLGNALREQAQLHEAAAACRRAIAINPALPEPHFNLSSVLLAQGNLSEGFDEYEWRWRCPDFAKLNANFPNPPWDGSPLQNRTLLLHTEQGFGDTLQFIRYLPLVIARGGIPLIECQPELQRLLQSLPHAPSIIARGKPLPHFDLHCPLLSLPKAFATTLANIPQQVPYLHAAPPDIEKWRPRFPPKTSHLKVGLAWAGSPSHKNNRRRSIPLATFAPLAQLPNIQFYSLQKSPPDTAPPPGLQLIDLMPHVNNFADTAALITHLDLIISVDSAVAHLAGALAKPVWTLLPFASDWRWLQNRTDSPWYPTMRLFRQPAIDDWPSVIHQLADALLSFRSQ